MIWWKDLAIEVVDYATILDTILSKVVLENDNLYAYLLLQKIWFAETFKQGNS